MGQSQQRALDEDYAYEDVGQAMSSEPAYTQAYGNQAAQEELSCQMPEEARECTGWHPPMAPEERGSGVLVLDEIEIQGELPAAPPQGPTYGERQAAYERGVAHGQAGSPHFCYGLPLDSDYERGYAEGQAMRGHEREMRSEDGRGRPWSAAQACRDSEELFTFTGTPRADFACPEGLYWAERDSNPEEDWEKDGHLHRAGQPSLGRWRAPTVQLPPR